MGLKNGPVIDDFLSPKGLETPEIADFDFVGLAHLPGKISETRRVPRQGSRRVDGLPRLSGGAMGAHPHYQSHRVGFRHGAAAHRQDPRLPLQGDRLHRCLQTDLLLSTNMAAADRIELDARSDEGVKFEDGINIEKIAA